MKTLKLITLRILLGSGLFFNATAQGDIVEVDINTLNNDSTNTALTLEDNEIITEAATFEMAADVNSTATPNRVESNNEITFSTLPEAVINSVVSEYFVNDFIGVKKVTTSESIAYVVRILIDETKWDIFISNEGEIIMEEKI